MMLFYLRDLIKSKTIVELIIRKSLTRVKNDRLIHNMVSHCASIYSEIKKYAITR